MKHDRDLRVPVVMNSLYNRRVTSAGSSGGGHVECPLCRESAGRARFDVEGLGSVVVVCERCGLGWVHPLPAAEEIASFYPPAYYGGTGRKFTKLVEWGVRLVGQRHVRFLARRVPTGGRILDVGCGRGVLLEELAELGFEAHGFEVNPAAAVGVDERVAMRIGDDLASVEYADDFFDQVIIWHVLEHVSDPRATIEEIHRILKPGGEIVVAVPNYSSLQSTWSGPAWFHLDLPRHLYHFPVDGLGRLLRECGFEVGTAHHFSLRQNPFGWVQSALNKVGWLPRNGLYELLHSRRQGESSPFGGLTKAVLFAAFLVGMPIGLGLEIIATALRSGATVHVVAKSQVVAKTEETA